MGSNVGNQRTILGAGARPLCHSASLGKIRRAVVMIWCIHGLLGRGSDWDFLRDAGFEIRAPSLFGGDSIDDILPAAADVLLGYSMGARLALHVIESRPVKQAVLVSAGVNLPE